MPPKAPWLYLLAAVILEVAGTTCLKASYGLSRALPSVLMFVFYALSFLLMSISVRVIDISIAYAIWSGLGTAAIVFIGAFYFKEQITIFKLACIVLIILGVIGLKIAPSN